MYFGALGKCPICGGGLECFDGRYMCLGHISAWSKCTFSTTNPERLKGKWKTPQKGFEVGLCPGSSVSLIFNGYASPVS
jgi:hypothetical protein